MYRLTVQSPYLLVKLLLDKTAKPWIRLSCMMCIAFSHLNLGPRKYPITFPYFLASVWTWRKIQDPALNHSIPLICEKLGEPVSAKKLPWCTYIAISHCSLSRSSRMRVFPWVSWRAGTRWWGTVAAPAEMTMIPESARCKLRQRRGRWWVAGTFSVFACVVLATYLVYIRWSD